MVAPNGASLSPDVVDLLAGSPAPGQYAQAQPTTAPEVAGKVEKVVGNATVIRNGVSVALSVGDAVYKNDVIQTSDHSSVGISFPDGTALNLVANTRMALNEYSYDSSSTSNSALFSLVEGTFSFVAGRVAHTGDMKIATPVATMGIRGTTGSAHQSTPNEIASVSATLGDVTYMFTIDNDLGVDTHGIYDLILNGVVVGSISQPGLAWYLDQNGNLVSQLMSDSQLALDRALRDAVYDIERSDAVPHSTPGSNGSSESPPTEQLPIPNSPNLPDNSYKPFIIDLPVNGPTGPTIVPFTVTFVLPPTNPTKHAFTASNASVEITVPPHPAGANQPLKTEAALTFTDSNPGDTSFTTAVIGVTATGHVQGLPDPTIVETFLHADGVTQSAGSADGIADFAFSAPEGSFDYLSQGETVTLIYTVQVTNSDGVGNTQTVSVSVVGTNEAPVIQPLLVADPGSIKAPAGTLDNSGHFLPLVESNNFGFSDPNYDDTHTVTVAYDAAQSVSASQEIGSLTATLLNDSTDGNQGLVHWAFTVDPTLVNALAPGTVLREVFDIIVTDDFGGTAVKEVVITIDGPTTTGFVWLPNNPAPPASSGNWNIAADWSGGVVPGAHDSATIENPVVVTVNDSESVDNLTIAAGAIVDIVDPGSLAVFGAVSGGGMIELVSSSGEDPTLAINGTVTLHGGGTIDMVGAAADNKIVGVAGTNAELLNVDYTISGSGTIGQGDNNLTFVNDGTVNATATILIETGLNIIQNTGLLEATAGGTLIIDSGVENTATGTVKADGATLTITDTINMGVGNSGLVEALDGGVVTITAPSGIPNLSGGTIEADGAGSTISITASTLSGNGSAYLNLGTVESLDGGTITLTGHGGGVGNQATIDADGGTINLDGVAPVSMGGGVSNSGGALIEAQNKGSVIISAAGTMSNAGTVDADGGVVSVTAGDGVTNTNLLEATGGGTLEIFSDVDNLGGTIGAYGLGSSVQLSDATVAGGMLATDSLTSTSGGLIEVLAAGGTNTSVLDGSTSAVTVDGYVNVDAGAALELIGTIHDEGTINLASEETLSLDLVIDQPPPLLVIDGRVTLDGGGRVTLSGSDEIVGALGEGPNVLENFDTISGAGQIVSTADAPLKLHNEKGGIVDAAGLLTIDTGAYRILNAGRMEATQDGELDIESKLRNVGLVLALSDSDVLFNDHVHNKSDGTIIARGYHALVDFSDDRARNDGVIAAKDHGTVTFDDARVANDTGGIIEAIGRGSSVVFCMSCVDNDGTIKAAFGGTVSIDHSTIDNAYGIIAAYGYGSTVQLSGSTINHGELDSAFGGKIEILGGTASTFDDLTNCAYVLVDSGATLILRGAIDNDGLIVVDSTAWSGADLVIDGRVALAGWGVVELDGYADKITGASHGGMLDNFSTIDGDGQIGTGSNALTLDNERYGKIDATGTLVIDTGCNAIVNAGHLEATSGGTLVVKSDVDNKGGTIGAYGAHALIKLVGVTITGGTLATGDPYGRDDGVIEIVAAAYAGMTIFDGSRTHDPVTVAGFVEVDPGAQLELKGDIELKGGAIELDQTVFHRETVGSELLIDGKVMLDGYGDIALEGDHAGIVGVSGNDATLDNYSSIYGSRGGFIGTGNNALTLDNEQHGVIDSEAGDAGPLVIDTGRNAIINAGLLESSGSSELDLYSDVNNAGGTIGAYDAGSFTKLFGVTITGGTLATGDPYGRDDGVIEIVAAAYAGTTIFDGSRNHDPVTVAGFVEVDPGALLELKGDIDLKGGAIELDQTVVHHETVGSELLIDGKVSLDGYGDIALEGDLAGIVGAWGTNAVLDNGSYIYGSRGGFIGTGNNALTLVNETHGVIDSEAGDAGPLVIDTGRNVIDNAGVLEASGVGSTLEIRSDVDNNGGTIEAVDGGTVTLDPTTIDDTDHGRNDGTIAADGAGSIVDLYDGTKIVGGTLSTSGGGLIEVANARGDWDSNATFDGLQTHDGTVLPVTIDGAVQVDNNTSLTLLGTIINDGTIDLQSGHSGADLVIEGTVKLEGTGTVTLDGSSDEITGKRYGEGHGATLENFSTISGIGKIGGDGSLTLDNEGTGIVDADGTKPLILDTGHTIHNAGTLEATNGGTLQIDDSVCNTNTLEASGGIVDVHGAVYGSGSATIGASGILEFQSGVSCGQAVTFTDATGTLALSDPTAFHGSIAGLVVGDTIDLTGIAPSSIISATIEGAMLVVDVSGESSLTFKYLGSLSGDQFAPPVTDHNGGADLVLDTASAANSSVTAIPSPVNADGLQATTLTVTAADANGNLLPDATVTLSSTDSGDTFGTINGTTNASGVFTTTLSSTDAQNDTVQALIDGTVAETTSVNFVAVDTWTNQVGDGNWSTSANWSDGAVPVQNLEAVIASDAEPDIKTGATLTNVTLVNYGTLDVDTAVSGGSPVVDLKLSGTTTLIGGSLHINDVGAGGEVEVTSGASATFDDVNVTNHQTVQIDAAATLTLDGGTSVSGGIVSFAASKGTLALSDPTDFHATIGGILGSGNILDIGGYDTSTVASTTGGYDPATNTTTLTVTDQGHAALQFDLAGNFSNSSWTVTEDSGNAGVDIADPPAANSSIVPSVDSFTTANGAGGTITFADTDHSDALTASFTPENSGAGYDGSFSVQPGTASNGSASVTWGIDFSHDQINLAPGQTTTQSYEVSVNEGPNTVLNQTMSVSLGGPGNDNFVFTPGVGADTIVNFNPQQDTIDLSHFTNVQSTQQLASLISNDAHGDAMIDLGNHDSITLPGLSAAQLQAVLQSVVHLH